MNRAERRNSSKSTTLKSNTTVQVCRSAKKICTIIQSNKKSFQKQKNCRTRRGTLIKQIFHSSSKNRSDMALHILLAVVEYLFQTSEKSHRYPTDNFWKCKQSIIFSAHIKTGIELKEKWNVSNPINYNKSKIHNRWRRAEKRLSEQNNVWSQKTIDLRSENNGRRKPRKNSVTSYAQKFWFMRV